MGEQGGEGWEGQSREDPGGKDKGKETGKTAATEPFLPSPNAES